MTFVHPAVLWALPAIGLPVVLHFIFLNRSRKIRFSSIFLLREVYLKSLPRSRMEQWLLLLLRCLVVALLILAFSGPVLRRPGAGAAGTPGTSGTPLRLVILSDVSYSMRCLSQGAMRYKLAREAGISILKTLGKSDKAVLGFFSGRWEGVPFEWSPDFNRLQDILRASEPGFGKTDYKLALETAFKFLSEEEDASARKIVLMLSDGARHGFKPRAGDFDVSKIPFYDSKVLLLGISFDEFRDNAWVESFSVRGTGFWDSVGTEESAGGVFIDASFRIAGGSRMGWPVRLIHHGRFKDRRWEKRTDLKDKDASSLSWSIPQTDSRWPSPDAEGGRITGRVELKKDLLSADDSWFYSFEAFRKLKILCVYAKPEFMDAGRGGYFIRKMFESGRGPGLLPFSCDFADWSRLGEIRLDDYSAVILSGFSKIESNYAGILDSYVRRGGGLWIIPSPSTEITGLSSLANLLPAEIHRIEQRRVNMIPGGKIQGAGFEWEDFDLSRLGAKRFFSVKPKSDARVLWRFDDGKNKYPALLAKNAGRGRVLYWASTLDPEWTTLALKPIFAAWMGNALAWVSKASAGGDWRPLSVGDVFEKCWDNPNLAPLKVKITDPGKRTGVVAVHNGCLRFDGTRLPGIYRWLALPASRQGQGVPDSGTFAVNVDPSSGESDLTAEPSPPWKKIRLSDAADDFMSAAHGVEIASGILLAALVFLFAEGLLSRKVL